MNRGRAFRCFVALALLALSPFPGPLARAAGAPVEVRKLLDTTPLGDPFVFDVEPGGAVLVLTRDNVYDAGAGEFLFGEPLRNPAWLGFAGGTLHLLADGALFAVDGTAPRRLLDVPLKGRVFASDGERTFLAGTPAGGRPKLFLYKEGRGHKPLLETDAPIDAMALARGALFFSVGPRIYALREGGPARLVANLPGFGRIVSLSVDDRNGLLYFSDGDDLYALRGAGFVLVRRGLGGMLRFREEALYVLSWRDRALYRVSGLAGAVASAGSLAPLADPCKEPPLSLYCEAAERRAAVLALSLLEGEAAGGDAVSRNELASALAGQKDGLDRNRAALAKEAETGAVALRWGGGREPESVRARQAISTGGKGAGLALWDGGGFRIGPDSKTVVDACGPSGECLLTLDKGLLYFEPYKPPVEGMAAPTSREYAIATGAATLRFGQARLALYASGGTTSVVVLEGRVKAVTPEGESVIVASGETLELARGGRPGTPVPAELERLNRWWEEIR